MQGWNILTSRTRFSPTASKNAGGTRGGSAMGAEAAWALYDAIIYIVTNNIPGDIVECGVLSGGSMLLAAHTLMRLGDTSRRIYLYDTFAGMPRPDAVDTRWD